MNDAISRKSRSAKTRPAGATQHVTAGPYSPVLEIDARQLVVISGQVAVDQEGNVIGNDVETQTEATLSNCATQLATAACTFADVFKVNIYLTDLADWGAFNAVYERQMPEPMPVRTAIQSVLLPGFLVEIEMWAAKPAE